MPEGYIRRQSNRFKFGDASWEQYTAGVIVFINVARIKPCISEGFAKVNVLLVLRTIKILFTFILIFLCRLRDEETVDVFCVG